MSYKNKVLKKRLFTYSLSVLKNFALSEPQLPLKNRRAMVAAISVGGSLANPYKRFVMMPSYQLNYQYTRLGLIRACSDKLINATDEENQKVKKAICNIASLSAWAKTSPNLSEEIFDDFIQEIVPEDATQSKAITEYKKECGGDAALDLVSLSGNLFYKKYQGK